MANRKKPADRPRPAGKAARAGTGEPASSPSPAPAAQGAAAPVAEVRRPWAAWLLLAVLAFGLVAAVLMTWHHESQVYGGGLSNDLVGCSTTATVNCDVVNASRWSELAGIPIATLAAAVYLACGYLVWLALSGRRGALALLLAAGGGLVLASALLLYVSLAKIGFLCSWCLRMYVVNLAVPALALAAGGRPRRPERTTTSSAAAAFAGAALLAIGAQQLYHRTLVGGEVVAPTSPSSLERDPDGQAPELEVDVTSEDGKPAVLATDRDDAWRGKLDSPVIVVEFADFECPACRLAARAMETIYASYGDRVLFIFKHFPLNHDCNRELAGTIHPHACDAARAAACARDQRLFWRLHDVLFANQGRLERGRLRRYAELAGLDLAAYDACLAGSVPRDAVGSDVEAGNAVRVGHTPTVYIDGVLYKSTLDPAPLGAALDAALARQH